MKFHYVLFLVGFVLLVVGSYMIFSEIKGARDFCKSNSGIPSFSGKYCNGELLIKYSDGWDFKRVDFSNYTFNSTGP